MAVYVYRAVAECDACGRVQDVGPAEGPKQAMSLFDGWLSPGGGVPLQWVLSDAFGTRFTVCPECFQTRSLREVTERITERLVKRDDMAGLE